MKTLHIRSRPALATRFFSGWFVSLALAAVLLAGSAWSEARSVILLIGDGMGPAAVKAASIKLKGADGKLVMQGLPVYGTLCTTSFGGEVTDSAAAATALATGYKTKNGMIGMTPDGSLVRSIVESCRDFKKSTGIVVTSSVTDATPAGFAAHASSRGMQYDIAEQMLACRVNVILGGGKSSFLERHGEAWVGVDFVDAKGMKLASATDRIRWTADQETEHGLVAPPGTAKASIWIWRDNGGVDALFDDVRFEPKEAKPRAGIPNLVVNGDFENGGTGGWNVWDDCSVTREGSSLALRVASGGGLDQAVAAEPGVEYTFTYRSHIVDPYAGSAEKRTAWDGAGKAGYLRIEKKAELAKAKGQYVLGLFAPGALENTPAEPTLAEMTAKSIDLLKANPSGFFLMVEGSQIDWGVHGNDLEDFSRQIGRFDEAVKIAVAYAKKKGDVLVIVTADHETAGVSVEGKNAKDLKVTFAGKDHTDRVVPVFAYGPGSKSFEGPHDNTDVRKLITKALGLLFD
jgi:alkaline phosphatase